MAETVKHARQELRQAIHRLNENDKAMAGKQRERRENREKVRTKRERDPKSDERAKQLDKDIKKLTGENARLSKRILELIDRHKELAKEVREERADLKAAQDAKEKASEGPDAAVKWMMSQVGVHEEGTSNWGHPVQDWILRAGYSGPVPWCGCFAHEGVVVVGGAKVSTQIGYAGNVIADARAGRNGLRAVSASEAEAGDICSMWNAEHVLTLRGKPSSGQMPTIEGNTSPTVGMGSESNGGAVAAKIRNVAEADVFARPAW